MKEGNLFLKGAMILAVAGIISKVMGSVYTIFLQNIIGDRGLGLYQMAYPIYSTLLILSTAGFPIAVSKFVAEHAAIGDYLGAKKVFRIALVLLFLTGVIFFFLLFYGAPWYAKISGDPDAVYAIEAIAPALLIVPVMSAIRGYFQGWQQMEPTAVSQVLEQFVRVGTIIIAAVMIIRMGYDEKWAAAGAAFGAVTGAIVSLVVLILYMWRRRVYVRNDFRMKNKVVSESNWAIIKKLFYYALPVSLGALVVPMMNNVDLITVVNLLKQGGTVQSQATEMFGLLSGRAFKLMLLPSTFATAIAAALMPAIAAALAQRDQRQAYQRMELAMRMTILVALPATVGMAILAEPIDITLFTDNQGTSTIMAISLATLFSSLQLTTSAILQGMGLVYAPVRNLLIGGVIKFGLNLLFVPLWGIVGAAVATVVAYAIATLLNLLDVYRKAGVVFDVRALVTRPLMASVIMGAIVLATHKQLLPLFLEGFTKARTAYAADTLITITVAGIVYGFALLVTGTLQRKDIESIPRIGLPASRLLLRFGLIK